MYYKHSHILVVWICLPWGFYVFVVLIPEDSIHYSVPSDWISSSSTAVVTHCLSSVTLPKAECVSALFSHTHFPSEAANGQTLCLSIDPLKRLSPLLLSLSLSLPPLDTTFSFRAYYGLIMQYVWSWLIQMRHFDMSPTIWKDRHSCGIFKTLLANGCVPLVYFIALC